MLSQLLSSTALTAALVAARPSNIQARDQRVIYDVAHKVLRVDGLHAALDNGANAIEIDLTAYPNGNDVDPAPKWWIDHASGGKSLGDPADVLIPAIGDEGAGKLAFVVFDIKTPQDCPVDDEACGMAGVVNMARDLNDKGIGVVYGFINPSAADKDGWRYVMKNIEHDTAVRITGLTPDVMQAYGDFGSAIPYEKRIIDYGNPDLYKEKPGFGECKRIDDYGDDICPSLAHAVEERDNGQIGPVMLWTVGSSDDDGKWTAEALDMGIDGVVYGYGHEEYKGDERNLKARGHITNWVDANGDKARMAGPDDRPWY
ncbi:hypothetical protein ACO1O0_007597 [Amphichorda felina]